VTSISLRERERDALIQIAKFRFLTAEQLTEFLFRDRPDLKESSRLVMTRQLLSTLQKKGLIARTSRSIGGPDAGSVRSAYYVRPDGMRVVWEFGVGREPKRTAPRGTFLLRHALALADIALAFEREARQNAGHAVVVWEPDWEAAQRADRLVVVPDAFLMYAAPPSVLDAFVEMDLGTMGSRFFQRKIERYLELYRGETWKGHLPSWPTVLTVTTSPTRSLLLRSATERALGDADTNARLHRGTEFAFCDLATLMAKGPLAPIWQFAGSDRATHALLEE